MIKGAPRRRYSVESLTNMVSYGEVESRYRPALFRESFKLKRSPFTEGPLAIRFVAGLGKEIEQS